MAGTWVSVHETVPIMVVMAAVAMMVVVMVMLAMMVVVMVM